VLNSYKNINNPARAMLAYSEGLKNFLGTLKAPAGAGARSALPLIRVYES